ncbi:MAG: biopolymer transporter ExbD [Planctomycetaceae bacterium]
MLSVSTKRGGTVLDCPACKKPVRVPTVEEVQELLKKKQQQASTAQSDPPVAQAPAVSASTSPPSSVEKPSSSVPREALPSEPAPYNKEDDRFSDKRPNSSGVDSSEDLLDEEDFLEDLETIPAPSEAEIAAAWEKREKPPSPWSRAAQEEPEEEEFQLGGRDLDESGLDMTPMVDVTFLLLIFFMITASFSMQKSMEVNPPEPDEDGATANVVIEDQQDDSIIVGISENDSLTVNDEPVSGLSALVDVMKARMGESSETSMTIELDPRASFGALVGVMDAGITVGMQSIKRVTRPVDE